MIGERLTEIFLQLFCEKNSNGTKNLVLKGKDLYQRIGQRLSAFDMLRVVDFLEKNQNIVSLDVCYNDIGDEGLRHLCDNYLVESYCTIESLNLMNCSLTGVGMERLYFVCIALKLRTLRLNGNKLGQNGGRFLSMLLQDCPTLHHLDFGDTDQIVDSVNYILIKGQLSNLTVLDLSRVIPSSNMYQYGPEDLADNLGYFLERNVTIIELHAQKCEMDGHDMELLLYGLRRNTSLKLLDLSYNRIGEFGIDVLAEWLRTRPNLLGLKVAGNGIKNVGARALSFGMPFSKLRLLDVGYNQITDEGLIDILNSIKKPYMLRMFYFWGNKFGHKTNKILERMLSSTVLQQEYIDVKLYTVDEIICAAYYPADHYKHRYYSVMDYGCPVELKIKRNKIEEDESAKPRALVRFKHVDRFPIIDEKNT